MERSAERTERTFIKLSLGIVIGLVVLIGAIWLGYDSYGRWQERRLLRRANLALQDSKFREANLAARTVLQSNPNSVGAARVMADLAERAQDRNAVDWRRKIAEATPENQEDLLAWARAALQLDDVATAERALARLNEAGRQTAGYHAVSALLAQARRDEEKADQAWTEALRLAPEEKAYQLKLGILRLGSREPARRESGEKILRDLRSDPTHRSVALRALINDGIARQQKADELIELGRELQSYPEATLADRLLYLDFLHQRKHPDFTSYLTTVEKDAAQKPGALTQLLSWMSAKGFNVLALDFTRTLPAETLEKWPVPLGVADIYLRLKDWNSLERLTKNANWRQSDFLRHAYLARAYRARDEPVQGEREWTAAVKEASAQSAALLSLVQLTLEWNWATETNDLLWALTKLPDKRDDAFATLYRHYARKEDTPGLYRVMLRLAELDPGNLNLQNNVAQIGMLLNVNAQEARRIALELHRKEPQNAAYTSTYAYSLLTDGDAKGALAAMQSLKEEQLRDPAVGTYYGIILAAAKDQRAGAFLQLARNATLLPEERALVARAENSLR